MLVSAIIGIEQMKFVSVVIRIGRNHRLTGQRKHGDPMRIKMGTTL